jgi:8-oxo-dGTP pyrophosphatase MutT (NUDIX family)
MAISDHLKQVREKYGQGLLLLPGVSALVFNDAGEVLLGRRSDNGRWAVIGGIVDPGEEPAAACRREVLEETGVEIAIDRISGVYLSPVVTYPNGDVAQYVITAFRCRTVAGEPRAADDESLEVRFFALNQLPDDLREDHELRILHASDPSDERAFFF